MFSYPLSTVVSSPPPGGCAATLPRRGGGFFGPHPTRALLPSARVCRAASNLLPPPSRGRVGVGGIPGAGGFSSPFESTAVEHSGFPTPLRGRDRVAGATCVPLPPGGCAATLPLRGGGSGWGARGAGGFFSPFDKLRMRKIRCVAGSRACVAPNRMRKIRCETRRQKGLIPNPMRETRRETAAANGLTLSSSKGEARSRSARGRCDG